MREKGDRDLRRIQPRDPEKNGGRRRLHRFAAIGGRFGTKAPFLPSSAIRAVCDSRSTLIGCRTMWYAEALLKKGAKVDVENWNGKTPPRSDAMYGRTAVRLTRVGGEQNVLGFDEGGGAMVMLTFAIASARGKRIFR